MPLRAVSLSALSIHYSAPHGRKAMDRGLLLLLIGGVLPIIVLLFLLWRSTKTTEHFRPRIYALFPIAVSMWLHLGHTNVSNS